MQPYKKHIRKILSITPLLTIIAITGCGGVIATEKQKLAAADSQHCYDLGFSQSGNAFAACRLELDQSRQRDCEHFDITKGNRDLMECTAALNK